MTTIEVIRRATQLGLTLSSKGPKLVVSPAARVPREFVPILLEHKPAILEWLASGSVAFRPDELPWIHVARQVLAGEFEGANDSLRRSIAIGLRSIRHSICRAALARIGGDE